MISREKVGLVVRQAFAWLESPEHPWVSWVGHTAAVWLIAAGFSMDVAMFCYAFREGEQALVKWRAGKPIDAVDALLDITFPLVILGVLSWYGLTPQ